jgi:hypothetical protein
MPKSITGALCRSAFLVLLSGFVSAVFSQTTAVLTGTVVDPSGAAISGAQVVLENAVTGFHRTTESKEDGYFVLSNVPFQTYQLQVNHEGFVPSAQSLSLRSTVPTTVEMKLQLATNVQNVHVSAVDKMMLVNPEETGTRAQMDHSTIEKMALQVGNRGLESVLVTFPGFEQNANGAIHPRGAHNQMTYVVDGMPISDQLTGAFANAVDASIVQTLELYTGNIPVEYGNKVAAVANITTISGTGTGKAFTGSISASAAGFDTLDQVTQVAGEKGKFGYSASLNTLKTHRYLDQVSLDNLHNGGHSTRGFFRLDYTPSEKNILRLNLMAGSSPFELANLRSQQANGMNQRQLMRDFSSALAWVHTINSYSTYETNVSYRSASAQLFDSQGDTPVTASQARRLGTFTVANRYNLLAGRHNFRVGFDFQRFAARENFMFGIKDPTFNDPSSPNYNPALFPHDLTRGGSRFVFGDQGAGWLYSGYGLDSVRYGRFQLSLGLRYDAYRFLSRGIQWQPRVGVSFNLKETGTVLRVSYNRLYQTPVNENLLLSNSPQAAILTPPAVRAALGQAYVLIRPERQNFYEAGLQQALFGKLSLGLTYYHKQAWDQADNNNFFNTGIIFPISLAGIRVNSFEGRLVMPFMAGFSGTLSVTHSRAISTPPFTGGLFIGNDAIVALTQGPFVIDHDQKLAVHGILNYATRKGIYSTLSMRYDSGLVVNPSDPAAIARDPDYADLLPYVNLAGNPPRAKPRLITDIVLGYEHKRENRRQYDASIQVSNLIDKTALYNFQSIFVGTRVVQPLTVGVRLRWFF